MFVMVINTSALDDLAGVPVYNIRICETPQRNQYCLAKHQRSQWHYLNESLRYRFIDKLRFDDIGIHEYLFRYDNICDNTKLRFCQYGRFCVLNYTLSYHVWNMVGTPSKQSQLLIITLLATLIYLERILSKAQVSNRDRERERVRIREIERD